MNSSEFKDQMASERSNTINYRIATRNIPSQSLQPYLDARPVSTKYSIMPIVDPRKPINVPLKQFATYNMEHTFNPGNDFGPWSGYASNVNRESELRNQIYALQDCSQSVYVPSSKSDLYQVNWQQQNVQQPFPELFRQEMFQNDPTLLSREGGHALFHNSTRQEIKNTDC
jgi:hypothetical protein